MLQIYFYIFVLVGCTNAASNCDHSTGAGGPANWTSVNSICGGSSQSPIDLPTEASMTYDADLTTFTLTNFGDTSKYTVYIENNGHTVQGTIQYTGSDYLEVTGGGLTGTFRAEQFHFHWGSTSSRGSEHTHSGTQYAAELHIVCWDTSQTDFSTAASQANGLAVLVFFIEESGSDNSAFTAFENELANVANKDTNVTLASFNLYTLLPTDISKYYRYPGSLTTPNCYESVIWTVFKNKIQLSTPQI